MSQFLGNVSAGDTFEEKAEKAIGGALEKIDQDKRYDASHDLLTIMRDCTKNCPQKLPDLIDQMQKPIDRLFEKGEGHTAAQILRHTAHASRDAGAFGVASIEKTMDLFEKYEPSLSKMMGESGSTHDIASDIRDAAFHVSANSPDTFARAKVLSDLSPHRADPLTPITKDQISRVETHAKNLIKQKPPGT